MCGIVGAVAQRNVTGILLEGLKRLEYRGYDSAGLAILSDDDLQLLKTAGKVENLVDAVNQQNPRGTTGIAHTRWATHGAPSDKNSHPHRSGHIAVVHNGIIENHNELRQQLTEAGYTFLSDTDTEVVAHLVNQFYSETNDLKSAVQNTLEKLDGAYAIGVISSNHPNRLIAARIGSPLVIGVGMEECFIASDPLALRQVTDRFIYLAEGDFADIDTQNLSIFNVDGDLVERQIETVKELEESSDKGEYRHYMLKEIHEQSAVIANTLQGRVSKNTIIEESFGVGAQELFSKVENIQIIACGTSFHAGLIAKYWFEDWAELPCSVEVASEFRYRKTVVRPNTLFVTISQSGETADTLAALRASVDKGFLASLSVCNVPNSSLVRESDLRLMTLAGPEIGVASTKAFTTQLVALQILVISLAKQKKIDQSKETELVKALKTVPYFVNKVLELEKSIEVVSQSIADKFNALFLGRGVQYPVALEGALKLKEISYIHAEAYPAGELKHGPLALVDSEVPVIAVAPNNDLLEKLKSNLQEVQARGGQLFVFADVDSEFSNEEFTTVINLPHVPESIAPIIYTIPLQLLSYYVAVARGTDVDQPRNLAKSVTVE